MRSGPRLLRVVAALFVLLALSIDRGTGALWSDSGTVPGGTIHTGRVDLRVDGQDAVSNYAPLDLSQLVPGQTAAAVLTVSNAGNVSLEWTASTSGTNSGNGLLGALQLRVTGASSVTGSTCGGSSLPGSSTSADGPLVSTPRTLNPGASEQVCVQVGLPAGASSTLAATTTDLTLAIQGSTSGWSDTASVAGISLTAATLTPPTVTCSGVPGLNLSMGWTEVSGATSYRVVNSLGGLLTTIASGGTLSYSLGALTGAKVQAVYAPGWISAGAGC